MEIATHFAGGKVVGVRLASDGIEIQVAVDRLPLVPVIGEIHEAAYRVLSQCGDSRPVRVVVADIDVDSLV
ncbi:MAG: hypothetical protein H0T78_11240 [Longispora sp.]|nr:hypothetical protein [Longispora sp. (in: high G+C Gram-positive bacteria)]